MSQPPFTHRRRITYSECTVGNHVYYSRYLDFLEEARGEFFRAIGWPLVKLEADGFAFPVKECQLIYEAPSRYDDLLAIELWIAGLNRLWLKFGFTIRGENGEVVVAGRTDHVCTSFDGPPRRMPGDLVGALQPFVRI